MLRVVQIEGKDEDKPMCDKNHQGKSGDMFHVNLEEDGDKNKDGIHVLGDGSAFTDKGPVIIGPYIDVLSHLLEETRIDIIIWKGLFDVKTLFPGSTCGGGRGMVRGREGDWNKRSKDRGGMKESLVRGQCFPSDPTGKAQGIILRKWISIIGTVNILHSTKHTLKMLGAAIIEKRSDPVLTLMCRVWCDRSSRTARMAGSMRRDHEKG